MALMIARLQLQRQEGGELADRLYNIMAGREMFPGAEVVDFRLMATVNDVHLYCCYADRRGSDVSHTNTTFLVHADGNSFEAAMASPGSATLERRLTRADGETEDYRGVLDGQDELILAYLPKSGGRFHPLVFAGKHAALIDVAADAARVATQVALAEGSRLPVPEPVRKQAMSARGGRPGNACRKAASPSRGETNAERYGCIFSDLAEQGYITRFNPEVSLRSDAWYATLEITRWAEQFSDNPERFRKQIAMAFYTQTLRHPEGFETLNNEHTRGTPRGIKRGLGR